MKIISLFSGCGGLDLGFRKAGFNVIWANEYDRSIWDTYEYNHPDTILERRNIKEIKSSDVPDSIGMIGGPPCQSWSEAGARRGINDSRGQLFYEYIRLVEDKKPLFFLAENVRGILSSRHIEAFTAIVNQFRAIGYNISYQLLNANDFGVPQDRQRVIIIGYHEKLGGLFQFPQATNSGLTLKDSIYDLSLIEPLKVQDKIEYINLKIPNHEYLDAGYSSIYMSRNRVRSWDQPSFTIQAGGRHSPIHPQANKMILVAKDRRIFDPLSPKPYRRLSVRECARIQTFPDDFIFKYQYINHGYKMVGNAVPVNLAQVLATRIYQDIKHYLDSGDRYYLKTRESPQQLTLRFPQ